MRTAKAQTNLYVYMYLSLAVRLSDTHQTLHIKLCLSKSDREDADETNRYSEKLQLMLRKPADIGCCWHVRLMAFNVIAYITLIKKTF